MVREHDDDRDPPLERQIRADFDENTIIVYQAYPAAIAHAAVAANRFVAPFKVDRMTWIKPSFLWLMYRSGWASKPGQEVVLAIRITREGFEWALMNSCLSHFDREIYQNEEAWRAKKERSPVRVQWDPERDLTLKALPYRSLQVGLGGAAVRLYLNEWILRIEDITQSVRRIAALAAEKNYTQARSLLPDETPYPLPSETLSAIGASHRTKESS